MTPRENFCSCCRKSRDEEGKGPQTLIRLPTEIAQLMNKPGKPIRLCKDCDGEAYKEAMRHYDERTKK